MNKIICNLLDWYQIRIGSHDKQAWEKSLDSQSVKHNLYCLSKKSTKIDDLIDIDLIKGSSFPKSKSKLSLANIMFNGIVKLVFLPFYFRWWEQQINKVFTYTLMFIYFLQLINFIIYNSNYNTIIDKDQQLISLTEISTPGVIMLILGIMYSYITSALPSTDSEKSRSTKVRTQTIVTNQNDTKISKSNQKSKSGKKNQKFLSKSLSAAKLNLLKPNNLDQPSNSFSENRQNLRKRKITNGLEDTKKSPIEKSKETSESSRIENLSEFNLDNFNLYEYHTTTNSSCYSSSSLRVDTKSIDETINLVPENSLNSETNQNEKNISLQDNNNYLYEYQDDDYVAYEDDDDDDDEVEDEDEENLEEDNSEITEYNYLSNENNKFFNDQNNNMNVRQDDDVTMGEDLRAPFSNCSTPPKTNNNNNNDNNSKNASPKEVYKKSQKTSSSAIKDKIFCLIWQSNEWKGADLSMLEISNIIIGNVEKCALSLDYFYVGLFFSALIAVLPIYFHNNSATLALNSTLLNETNILHSSEIFPNYLPNQIISSLSLIFDFIINIKPIKRLSINLIETVLFWTSINLCALFVIVNTVIITIFLGILFFTLLTIAERTLSQRFLHAKFFCYLTSNRRARKHNIPHFRLGRVENIKTWLSVRSYMKRRGPQRSIDAIISSTFLIGVGLCSSVCIRFLQDSDFLTENLADWQLVIWCLCIWTYMLRFMTIGFKINKKYRNCMSMVITEQINLYLEMEKKPEKKDELLVVNNVLKLAADLLKEVENPFKISGLGVNPWVYNVTKVVILSAASAVLSELFGFKLKLYKIKIG
ncbi:unnamed protein product [Brachionus calyciflorus]|uniref:PHTF1/2 N-terminal domain-containing protein n=1 Tax=Brachionus calyciflorus TaxID=104777 RepID=A0A813Y3U3_9BILA|nr:unnamed protein product [Brachionus calyciflorus]